MTHNRRNPVTETSTAEIIHSFDRADGVERERLARLVRSISRFLDSGDAVVASIAGEAEVIDCRPSGGAWILDRLWQRLGIDQNVKRLLARMSR
ncbi:MAG: hypothetical protein M0027_17590 [Candidatus Dormibacteraeota bacterium]|nr:hypothetical protein [Candidatus Dormibacteraeota bacterium]